MSRTQGMRRGKVQPSTADGPSANGWYVYVVECADRSLYTGIARDVAARVACHNEGNGARYTRSRLPVRLAYVEPATDRSAALKREYAIKRLPLSAKRALLAVPTG